MDDSAEQVAAAHLKDRWSLPPATTGLRRAASSIDRAAHERGICCVLFVSADDSSTEGGRTRLTGRFTFSLPRSAAIASGLGYGIGLGSARSRPAHRANRHVALAGAKPATEPLATMAPNAPVG